MRIPNRVQRLLSSAATFIGMRTRTDACFVNLITTILRPNRASKIAGTYFFADEFGKLYSAISVPEAGVYKLTPAAGSWACAADSPVDCGSDIGLVFSFFETADGESE